MAGNILGPSEDGPKDYGAIFPPEIINLKEKWGNVITLTDMPKETPDIIYDHKY